MPPGHRRRDRQAAGRGRGRRPERRGVRQVDQLVAVSARAHERLRASAGGARRESVRKGGGPDAVRRVLRRDRRQGGVRDRYRIGLRRADRLYRAGGAPARHRQLQGGAQGRPGRGGVPARCGAVERHPGPQERVLPERRGLPGGDRGGNANGVPHDRRRRLRGAARRRAGRSRTTGWCRRRASPTTGAGSRATSR